MSFPRIYKTENGALRCTYVPQPRQQLLHNTHAVQILYGGSAGGGKLIPVIEKLPTPSGWTVLKDLNVGDTLFDEKGNICRVTKIFDTEDNPELWEFEFDDGTTITSCIDHLWLTYDAKELGALTRRNPEFRARRRTKRPSRAKENSQKPWTKSCLLALNKQMAEEGYNLKPVPSGTVRTTREIIGTLKVRGGTRANHAIPVAEPLNLVEKRLTIDPYVLGAWLGDGNKNGGGFTGIDRFIWEEIERRGYKVSHYSDGISHRILKINPYLRISGVLNNKHIPVDYLRASRQQRLDLLRGLMDTDGTVAKHSGSAEFCNTNERIVDGVCELINSLGWKVRKREGRAKLNNNDCGQKWTLKFVAGDYVFNLPRKRELQKLATRRTTKFRYIIAARPVKSEPGKCIQVDSPSRLFLAGRQMVPTHNTEAIRWDAILFCLRNPGLNAFLFRKTLPDLKKTHIDAALKQIPREVGVFVKRDDCFQFRNGSRLYFCFCDSNEHLEKYLSYEMHWLGIDEGTTFEPNWIIFLRSRLRLGSFKPCEADSPYLPRFIIATNPSGGPGHQFIKKTFVDAAPRETVFKDNLSSLPERTDGEGNLLPAFEGYDTIFIPASMRDNKFLDKNYEASFNRLPPELRKAYVDGDWSVTLGAALHNLSQRKHKIPQIKSLKTGVPDYIDLSHCLHFMSMDWGTRRPFSVNWYVVVDEGFEISKIREGEKLSWFIPSGAVVMYAEWYGADDSANRNNAGLGLPAAAVARGILQREQEWGLRAPDYRVADYQLWSSQTGGPSPVIDFNRHGVMLRQSFKDRKANYQEIISRLAGSPTFGLDGKESHHPMFFVTENCSAFWDTVPPLVLDDNDPDKGPSKTKRQEDHVYDSVAYALATQPFVLTKADREQKDRDSYREAFMESQKDIDGGAYRDPYSTA